MGGDVEVITGGGEERQCTIYGAPDNSSTTSRVLLRCSCTSHIYVAFEYFCSASCTHFEYFSSKTCTHSQQCSFVAAESTLRLERASCPLHWMADLPHHPFSGVTLIKSALRCLPLLFSNSSSSAPTPAVILHAFFKLAGDIFYV